MWNQMNIITACVLALGILFVCVTGLPQEKQIHRIVGGAHASISDVPFIASIFVVDPATDVIDDEIELAMNHWCGGSVISARHVLSAVHCFKALLESTQFAVRLGSVYDFYGGVIIPVKSFTTHPDFNVASFGDSDIAIAKLTDDIPLGAQFGIQLATLPSSEVTSGQMLTSYRWGYTELLGRPSHSLLKVDIPVVDRYIFQERYWNTQHKISSNMFCGGYLNTASRSHCHGDSGGPVAEHGIVHGIVSYGKKCADLYYPTVFTAVIEFVPWILSNINELQNNTIEI